VALIWGATFVIVKSALQDVSTIFFLTARFTVATFCLLPLLVKTLPRANACALRRGLRGGALSGVFLWLGYVLQTAGLRYTTPGRSAFLTGLYIVLVPVFSAAINRKRPQAGELAGLALAASGMLALTAPAMDSPFLIKRGDLLTLGCAVAFALQVVAVGFFSQREVFELVAFGQIAFTALLSALCLPFERLRLVWTPRVLFAILITGILATAVAFVLQTWAQQRTPPTRTALIFALEPVFALATAIVVSGERLSLRASMGCVLILAGILFVELNPLSRR
jgi:drug/metabolite transporter (DMT)-like permease